MQCVIISLFLVAQVSGIFTPIVEISQGKLRGLRSISGQNRYYGIPYASSERFQPPQPIPKWEGILNAVTRFDSCAQTVSILALGSEDCLQLDVYTPEEIDPNHKIPVFVFFHGGAYYYGSKFHYDPEFLVVKNIVSVIVNYRVGVLGFLCLNGVANIGLKDQVEALKWIKRNIAGFGGDPDNVTIAGQSAGASAAAMHFLSKKSKGLFHKAVLMSGTPITPWAFNTEQVSVAFQDASKLGKVNTERDIFNTFLNASTIDLLDSCRDVSTNPRYFKYSPCVDSNLSDPFFHDTPYNILKSGKFNKVPIIVGGANVEGMLFYGINDDRTLDLWNSNFRERIPSVFSWCSKKDRSKIAQKMRSYYFGTKDINKDAVKGIVEYYSDWLLYSTYNAFISLMSEVSDQPIYSYEFAYEGGRNFAKLLFGYRTGLKGASHSDDIFYLFKPGGVSLVLDNDDRLYIDRLTTLLKNFMFYGDPTPKESILLPVRWPSTNNRTVSLQLGKTLKVIKTPQRGKFFLSLLCRYGLRGYVPCESKEECSVQ